MNIIGHILYAQGAFYKTFAVSMGNEVKTRNKKMIMTFGAHLRKIRTAKDLSQEALADLANMSFSQVNEIENGRINTSIGTVFQLAKGLKVHPKELFDF